MRLTFQLAAMLTGIASISAFGHSYGPAPRVTGAPGDNSRACTACHGGAALNSGPGNVQIILLSAANYIPGVKQRIAVRVSDPNQRRWGFEMTARLNSDPEQGQAGDFTPVNNMTQVICEDAGPKPCASGVSFIQHTSAGTRLGTRGGATFEFDWTPPSADAGPITFYAAGNAANGDGTNTGDLIYTTKLELTPVIPSKPAVSTGNIVSAATGLSGPVSPNSWITIYGSNLCAATRGWADSDFVEGGLPFTLEGVSVLLFGAPRLAYVSYVSPGQVNVLLPSDLAPGTVNVQVRNAAGTTTSIPITVQPTAPQLFTIDGKTALATHGNGAYVGRALPNGIVSTPAAPGETISIFGTGMGATTPALIPGQVPSAALPLATTPTVTIGDLPANVTAAVVPPNSAGLYQLNVQIPADAPNGDLPVVVRIGNASSLSTLISVQK